MPPIKKIIGWIIFAFLLYAVFTNPEAAANMVGSAWDIVLTGIKNIGDFFNSLLHRG